jgi:hypothetical protein
MKIVAKSAACPDAELIDRERKVGAYEVLKWTML